MTANPGAPAMPDHPDRPDRPGKPGRPGRDPDILTTEEVAARLGLSQQTVRRMAAAGQIPALKAGKNFRYSWTAVLQVLRQPHPHHPGGTTADDHTPPRKGAGYRAQRRAHTNAEHAD
ncbi:helix-turn-helix domain-containing protein [Thermomonospora cellulosilytica]|uniref:Excisionase family DNA binding protein n=1 Tax=Thermomonospora cellulosilytica TaxID=1411118 RepID=A0A7W3RBR5_9ACTN|nr:helix-turn-helix domain-containing protein [Thermomonospora cellulosilytica]MBA9007307.1 excisionase family DNA binding protein [Thermomonospora cellulosilytica]